jgi:hypothetical protein
MQLLIPKDKFFFTKNNYRLSNRKTIIDCQIENTAWPSVSTLGD